MKTQLFNIQVDSHQSHDQDAKHPEIVEHLKHHPVKLLQSIGVPQEQLDWLGLANFSQATAGIG
jgi:hypothetical protein